MLCIYKAFFYKNVSELKLPVLETYWLDFETFCVKILNYFCIVNFF